MGILPMSITGGSPVECDPGPEGSGQTAPGLVILRGSLNPSLLRKLASFHTTGPPPAYQRRSWNPGMVEDRKRGPHRPPSS